uniref:transmembrane protease serine 12 isoform X3 n=1 Tax=Panthera onca TaxID=9690 RepID=UPI0029535550|nr:transmembrane protease serine 12 isoform X3 [Panthera onca]
MEDSHKSNTSETAPQPGSAVQGAHISHIAQQMALRGSAPVTIIPLPGEQVQVQGVIQTAQSSVIHPPHVQTVSSLSESEESQDSSDSIGSSQKAHGILARRPSYRKILKDLSSEDTRGRKGDGENPGVSAVTSMSVPTPIYQTSSGQYTASGDMQTYQIRTTPSATSLPQTVVMTSPVTLTSQTSKTDDPQLKREIRLMKNRDPLMWRVVIGTNNIHGGPPYSKKIKVKAIIIHPDFNLETYVNDIALFHLKKAVRYNEYVQPICLPFDVFQMLDQNTKCFISGWGRTKEEGNVTDVLQEAEVHYISRKICDSEKSYGQIIPNTSFCAGDEDGIFDTCRGDSGGPLMCYLPEHRRFFVMGITSYGYGCGRKNFPGVYCGPSFYQQWLTDHLYRASSKGIFNVNVLLGQVLIASGSVVLLGIP